MTEPVIHDAEPDAWRGERRPDLSPDLLALLAALAAADRAGYRIAREAQ